MNSKWPFIIAAILFSSAASAQNDFLLLKKKGITIETFSSGENIEFTATNGNYVDAYINKIKDDTLYLKQYVVQEVPTTLGVYVMDTLGSYSLQYDYKDIKSFGQTGRHFDFSASGETLLGGGILIVLASGVVYLADNKQFSPQLMIAGAALGVIGYFIGKGGGNRMVIGKKYQLQYVPVN